MATSGENLFVSQHISTTFLCQITYRKKMAPSGMAGGTVKVVAICGSLGKGSYNKGLIRSTIELSKGAIEGVEIEEATSLLCRCSTPILKNKRPSLPKSKLSTGKFSKPIAFYSHLWSIISSSQNAMDWGSRPPNLWEWKVVGIVSARGLLGGARGQFHLCQFGIFIDLHILNKREFFLNAFKPPSKFNPLNGDLNDEDAKFRMKQILLSLKAFTLQLHHNN